MNPIMGAIVPNTDEETYFENYKHVFGKNATFQEYEDWKEKVEQLVLDIKESGIPHISWVEIRKALGAPNDPN